MANKGTRSRHSGLRKHSRLLTLLGALIVFTTFVVKEGMREHLKSVVDSLELADGIFALREDNAINHSAIIEVRQIAGSISSRLREKPRSQEIMGAFVLADERTYLVTDRLTRIEESIRNIRQLVGVLPRDPDLSGKLSSHEETLKKLSGEDDSLKWPMNNFLMASLSSNVEEQRKATDAMGVRIYDLKSQTENLEKAVAALASHALNVSETFRDSTERSYKRYSIASYILYAIGWAFGLVGRLSGLEVVAE
jgi:hypothetical protein